jgi:ABC-2 type transport system ATP-binding protein
LRALPGIVGVFQQSDAGTYLLECELGRDHRDEIARFIVGQGWGLLELKTISMTLEDVFLRLTQHEDGMAEVAAAAEETTA